MKGGPMSQAIAEAKDTGEGADVDRIARRHGIDAKRLKQRLSRAATFVRSIVENRPASDDSVESADSGSAPRRESGEKHRVQLKFRINGLLVKVYRREFYRGEIKMHAHMRRGNEQCSCGRDLISHAVPVVEDRRASLLCECGAVYEAERAS